MKHMNRVNLVMKWVKETCKDEMIDFKKDHPWRKPALHALQHGLRVYSLVEEIVECEQLEMTIAELELMKVAALIHDVGYIKDYFDHGLRSYEMAEGFLQDHFTSNEIEFIGEIVKNHSDKENPNYNQYVRVFQDADDIDEYGVQSILMCSNWVNKETPFFFKDLEKRMRDFEVPFGLKIIKTLTYDSSKNIVKAKMKYVEEILKHLERENAGSLDYETYLTI